MDSVGGKYEDSLSSYAESIDWLRKCKYITPRSSEVFITIRWAFEYFITSCCCTESAYPLTSSKESTKSRSYWKMRSSKRNICIGYTIKLTKVCTIHTIKRISYVHKAHAVISSNIRTCRYISLYSSSSDRNKVMCRIYILSYYDTIQWWVRTEIRSYAKRIASATYCDECLVSWSLYYTRTIESKIDSIRREIISKMSIWSVINYPTRKYCSLFRWWVLIFWAIVRHD